jgi:SAM-dependent methyltransferase
MHKSAATIGELFFETYCGHKSLNVLEIGSLNVNGSLRDFCKPEYKWVGVDLEPGVGVDIVITDPYNLPFKDKSFDVIVATSVFEHSSHFWLLFDEMVRLMAPGGLIYINAPSNGYFHRFPVDVFRFYPDAGKALQSWGSRNLPNLYLQESFIAEQNVHVWNDFVAVFSDAVRNESPMFERIESSNVWFKDSFDVKTFAEVTQDIRSINMLELEIKRIISEYDSLQTTFDQLKTRHQSVIKSLSWKITKPLRFIKQLLFRKMN